VEYANEVPGFLLDSKKECLSPRKMDDYQILGNSVVSLDPPSDLDVVRMGKTLIENEDLQAVDSGGYSVGVNDDSQDGVTVHKSARLRNLTTSRNQNFLW
jgi:hypothetical protein